MRVPLTSIGRSGEMGILKRAINQAKKAPAVEKKVTQVKSSMKPRPATPKKAVSSKKPAAPVKKAASGGEEAYDFKKFF